MHAIVRHAHYDPDRLAASPERMVEFERVHSEQPGYAGNLVLDLGGGERIMVTLWETEQDAAAARSTLGPVVRELLAPVERRPSDLVGAGPIVRTDLGLMTGPDA